MLVLQPSLVPVRVAGNSTSCISPPSYYCTKMCLQTADVPIAQATEEPNLLAKRFNLSIPTRSPSPIQAADVQIVKAADEKTTLAKRLTKLASNTEMKCIKDEKWQYLLDAGDVTPLIVPNQDNPADILGCVLRVRYGNHAAYGKMLVSPDARGQGLARKLLQGAMNLPGEMHILGTCTVMGQPLYEKIGYKRVSTVTRMTVDFENMHFQESSTTSGLDIRIGAPGTTSPLLDKFLALDTRATGLDRSQTLTAIQQYSYVSTTTIVDQNGEVKIAAMQTHHTGSPFIMVGPILGHEEYMPTLLHAIRDHYSPEVEKMALIVSDHPSIVERLQNAGFVTKSALGAMTLNGVPMPGERNLYLGLIHQTLG
jgi:GNAT superfamily N-acetyltransferase